MYEPCAEELRIAPRWVLEQHERSDVGVRRALAGVQPSDTEQPPARNEPAPRVGRTTTTRRDSHRRHADKTAMG